MNRHNQQNSLTPKALIYRIVITVTALFIVCLYMPRDERSTYQFDVGKPWRYSQLIATYDFPIYKSAETIQTEQDSILQHYEPYFAIDETVGKEQIEKFKATINGQKTGHHTGQLSGIRGKQTGTYLRAGRHGHGGFRPNAQR